MMHRNVVTGKLKEINRMQFANDAFYYNAIFTLKHEEFLRQNNQSQPCTNSAILIAPKCLDKKHVFNH